MEFSKGDRVYYADNGMHDSGTVVVVDQINRNVVVKWDDGDKDEYNFGQIAHLPSGL